MPARSPRALLVGSAFVAAAAGIVAATYGAYRVQADDLSERVDVELSAVANLQVRRLEAWHGERAAEATYVGSLVGLSRAVADLSAGARSPAAQADAAAALAPLLRNHEYRAAFLLDATGREVLHLGLPEERLAASPAVLDLARPGRAPVCADLGPSDRGGPSTLDLVVALSPIPGADGSASAGHAVLRLGPAEFYGDVLAAWPTPSKSGRTVLVRREGADLEYLVADPNLPASRPATLRKPADAPDLVGPERIDQAAERLDPRGVRSFVVVRPVAGTPWSVVALVDRAEVLEAARGRLGRTVGGGLLATGLLVAVFAFAARTRTAKLVAARLAVEQKRRELAERYEHLFRGSADAVLVFDDELRVVDANDQAVALYGWSLDELRTLRTRDLRAPEVADRAEQDAAAVHAEGRKVFQTVNRRKDGSMLAVEATAHAFAIDGRMHIESIVRDVTERSRAEQHLRFVNRANRLLGGVGQVIARVHDRQRLFEETCRVAVDSGEFSLAAIALAEPGPDGTRLAAMMGEAAASLGDPLAGTTPEAEAERARAAAFVAGPSTSVVDDTALDPRVASKREALAAAGVRSTATFPLTQSGRPIGAIRLGTREPGFFGPGELSALARVAETLSLGLDALERDERRRVAEAALERSEAALRSFFGDSAALMCLVEYVGESAYRFAMLNAPLARLLGLEPGPQPGRTARELGISDAGAAELRGHFLGLSAGDTTTWEQPIEIRGQRRTLLVSLSSIRTEDAGSRVGVLAVDITALRAAEEALEESRALLAAIVDAARDAIVVVDDHGRVARTNPAAEALLGRSAAELAGRFLGDFSDGRGRELLGSETVRVTAAQPSRAEELALRRPDGSVALAEASFSPLEARDARLCAIILRDVGERRREEEFRRVLARLAEQSSNLVLVTDTSGRIEYVNPRFTEVTGYAPADVLGKTPRVLQSGQTPKATYEALWGAILGGTTWQGELTNRTKGGATFVAAVTISPIVDDAGKVTHFVGSQEDVTERRRLEAEVRQSQKLESLGMLAGGVAHDFNNLLTAILGYASFLAEELPDGSDAQTDAHEIHRTAERAAALTRQLLAFSRRQAISPVELDLGELVVNLYKMLRRLIGEDVELSVIPSVASPFVMADPGQIEQVVMNLAVNARDAMPHGGVLRIETGFADVASAGGPMGPAPGRYAMLRVADTGAGMSEQTLARIFEPFFTTKEKGRGTGLGLATCFGIVKQSGGHIRVKSQLGEGSVFEVLLPAIAPSTAARAPSLVPAPRSDGRAKVLLVEDEPAVRAMAARVLADAGYEVVVASNGEDGLGIVQHHPDAFALLVTDVVMPRMGGVELATAARELCPALRVLLISGYVDGSALETLQRRGEPFLSKPFTANALVRRVQETLSGGEEPRSRG
jgi:PAS domain S-box-containing protein